MVRVYNKTARDKRGSDNPEDIDRYLWNTGFHFGEWLVPGRTGEGFEICKESAFYIAPYFGFWSLKLMADIQELLGEDSTYFRQTAEKMRQAIIDGIFKRDLLPDYLMGAYVLAFAFDLVPAELEKNMPTDLRHWSRKTADVSARVFSPHRSCFPFLTNRQTRSFCGNTSSDAVPFVAV